MRCRSIAVVGLVSACSTGTPEDWESVNHRSLDLAGDELTEHSDEFPEEKQIEPLKLSYVHFSDCAGTACEAPALSNVSEAGLLERKVLQPSSEFEIAKENAQPSVDNATEAALAKATELAAQGSGDEMLGIALYLEEEFFDFTRLRDTSEEQRKSIWRERELQLEASQSLARLAVESVGGKVRGQLQLTNVVYAEVPARNLEKLGSASIIGGIELDKDLAPMADGRQRRLTLVLNGDGLQSWGWDASQGSKRNSGQRSRIAVIDGTAINGGHLGFKNDSAGVSRIVSTFWCANGSCLTSGFTNVATHTTLVASALMSDFEDGQQSGLTLTQQQERGGIASEAELMVYSTNLVQANVASAINHAVFMNADIINMSIGPSYEFCKNDSYEGIRGAVQAAENAGVLVVVAAGNSGDLGASCRVNSLGAFPDSLTVGGTEDVIDRFSLATVGVYPATGANTSTQATNIAGGTSASTRMVDLTVTAHASSLVVMARLALPAASARVTRHRRLLVPQRSSNIGPTVKVARCLPCGTTHMCCV